MPKYININGEKIIFLSSHRWKTPDQCFIHVIAYGEYNRIMLYEALI